MSLVAIAFFRVIRVSVCGFKLKIAPEDLLKRITDLKKCTGIVSTSTVASQILRLTFSPRRHGVNRF
jgi:hypothetical protein